MVVVYFILMFSFTAYLAYWAFHETLYATDFSHKIEVPNPTNEGKLRTAVKIALKNHEEL